jgi:hypothetical protein
MNKINVMEVISADELALAQDYINAYAAEPKTGEMKMPIADILDLEWATEKSAIYKVFGEKLILRKEVSYRISNEEIANKIEELRVKDDSGFQAYRKARSRASEKLGICPCSLDGDSRGRTYYNVFEFIQNEIFWDYERHLAKNIYSGKKITFTLPDGKKYTLLPGAKLMKFLGKIAEVYGITEDFEKFRIEHSQILNSAEVKGTLCLSIHPLDYITMSENDSKWKSCMNWHDRGCYRRGTVEMMNSPYVIVAYVESKEPMIRFGKTWNNKKWRQLFVVSDEAITGIKAYPYYHNGLTEIAGNWIAEIYNAAGNNYNIPEAKFLQYDCNIFYGDITNTEWRICYETNVMYNDFGNAHDHYVIPNQYWLDEECPDTEINYSGVAQCMSCGCEISACEYNEDDSSAEILVCGRCGAPDAICDGCHRPTYQENLVCIDDTYFCPDCLEDTTMVDFISGERHCNYNFRSVFLTDTPDFDVNLQYNYEVGIRVTAESLNSEAWLEIFPKVQEWKNQATPWCSTYHYININDCSERAKEILEKNICGGLTKYLNYLYEKKHPEIAVNNDSWIF